MENLHIFLHLSPTGKFAEPLSNALRMLDPDQWKVNNFYVNLIKAIVSYDTADDGKPADDTSPGGGNLWKYFAIGLSILFLLVIIGVVIHLAMKRKS